MFIPVLTLASNKTTSECSFIMKVHDSFHSSDISASNLTTLFPLTIFLQDFSFNLVIYSSFIQCFILVGVVADPEFRSWVDQIKGRNGMPVHHRASCTHKCTPRVNLADPIHALAWEVERNPEETQMDTGRMSKPPHSQLPKLRIEPGTLLNVIFFFFF